MDRIPDAVEPALGYRAWLPVSLEGDARLRSVFRPVVWPAEEPLRAECRRWGLLLAGTCAGGEADDGCECGIYGLDVSPEASPSRGAAIESLRAGVMPGVGVEAWDPPATWVLGVVAGWGRVVVGSRGWRAEYATPVALFRPRAGAPGQGDAVGRLAAAYGVPVL